MRPISISSKILAKDKKNSNCCNKRIVLRVGGLWGTIQFGQEALKISDLHFIILFEHQWLFHNVAMYFIYLVPRRSLIVLFVEFWSKSKYIAPWIFFFIFLDNFHLNIKLIFVSFLLKITSVTFAYNFGTTKWSYSITFECSRNDKIDWWIETTNRGSRKRSQSTSETSDLQSKFMPK